MEISSVDLNEKIKSNEKLIVEFWAPWCGPCQMMKPVFERVASTNESNVQMYTMNIDNNREVAMSLGIRSIPTVKMFNMGETVETRVRVLNESQIKELVTELVNG